MSLIEFRRQLATSNLRKNERTWFPRWVGSYAASVEDGSGTVRITESSVIAFLQGLRDSGTAAWQRLQAVRAIEAYRNVVLQQEEPSLLQIRSKLVEIAARERQTGARNGQVDGMPTDEDVVGHLDSKEPEIIQKVEKRKRDRFVCLAYIAT